MSKSGEESNLWKGGKAKHNGYVLVRSPGHPDCKPHRSFYVPEHKIVMEKIIGRYLTKLEVVHHINGIKDDNRPENLVVITHTQHRRIHLGYPSANFQQLDDLVWLESAARAKTDKEIAVILGCNSDYVKKFRKKHGIKACKKVPDSSLSKLADKDWLQLQSTCNGQTAIAKRLGCSVTTISRAMAKHGIKPFRKSAKKFPTKEDTF